MYRCVLRLVCYRFIVLLFVVVCCVVVRQLWFVVVSCWLFVGCRSLCSLFEVCCALIGVCCLALAVSPCFVLVVRRRCLLFVVWCRFSICLLFLACFVFRVVVCSVLLRFV